MGFYLPLKNFRDPSARIHFIKNKRKRRCSLFWNTWPEVLLKRRHFQLLTPFFVQRITKTVWLKWFPLSNHTSIRAI
jgi:hypothetical protein